VPLNWFALCSSIAASPRSVFTQGRDLTGVSYSARFRCFSREQLWSGGRTQSVLSMVPIVWIGSWIESAPIPELVSAELAVVDRKFKKKPAQNIAADPLHGIDRTPQGKLAVTIQRACRPPLERGDNRPVEISSGTATVALITGS
jgi:hypothetical protein